LQKDSLSAQRLAKGLFILKQICTPCGIAAICAHSLQVYPDTGAHSLQDCESCSGTGFQDDPLTPCSPPLEDLPASSTVLKHDSARLSRDTAASSSCAAQTSGDVAGPSRCDRTPDRPLRGSATGEKENLSPDFWSSYSCDGSPAESNTFFAFSFDGSPVKPFPAQVPPQLPPQHQTQPVASSAADVSPGPPGGVLSAPETSGHAPERAHPRRDPLQPSSGPHFPSERDSGAHVAVLGVPLGERQCGTKQGLGRSPDGRISALMRAESCRSPSRPVGGLHWGGDNGPVPVQPLERRVSLDVESVRSRVTLYKKVCGQLGNSQVPLCELVVLLVCWKADRTYWCITCACV
jgi:hypothetical protein